MGERMPPPEVFAACERLTREEVARLVLLLLVEELLAGRLLPFRAGTDSALSRAVFSNDDGGE